MWYAIVNGEKKEAEPNLIGICPECGYTLHSKCGEINIWHWAHEKGESCDDDWHEPETEWHRNWKIVFSNQNVEHVIKKENKRHVADIFTYDNIVIELQNSPINKETIRVREGFYGERMMWIINLRDLKDRLTIKHTRYKKVKCEINGFDVVKGSFSRIDWERPRRSWEDVSRPVFLDFGDENLFMVEEGMGSYEVTGQVIKKEVFIKKYKGNLSLIHSIIKQ